MVARQQSVAVGASNAHHALSVPGARGRGVSRPTHLSTRAGPPALTQLVSRETSRNAGVFGASGMCPVSQRAISRGTPGENTPRYSDAV